VICLALVRESRVEHSTVFLYLADYAGIKNGICLSLFLYRSMPTSKSVCCSDLQYNQRAVAVRVPVIVQRKAASKQSCRY
jgi:hypothetical protein